MPIEINGNRPGQHHILSESRASEQDANASPLPHSLDNASSNTADTVSLTSTATMLQSLAKKIAEMPVIDVQRVNDLKHSFDNNSYIYNYNKVSEKLISVESQLNTL